MVPARTGLDAARRTDFRCLGFLVLVALGLVAGAGPALPACRLAEGVPALARDPDFDANYLACQNTPANEGQVIQGNETMDTVLEKLAQGPDGEVEIRVRGGMTAIASLAQISVRLDYVHPRKGEEFCTGVLIAPAKVLTAGHCGCGNPASYKVSFQREFRLGDQRLGIVRAPALFPGYDCARESSVQTGRDLALIRIDENDFKANIAALYSPAYPPFLPMFEVMRLSTIPSLTVTGFGRRKDGSVPNHLRMAHILLVDPYCAAGHVAGTICRMFREFALSNLPVSGGLLDADTCGGDSGGGVYYLTGVAGSAGRTRYQPLLVGITSRAIGSVRQSAVLKCGGGGIYTSIGTNIVLNWLSSLGVSYDLHQFD